MRGRPSRPHKDSHFLLTPTVGNLPVETVRFWHPWLDIRLAAFDPIATQRPLIRGPELNTFSRSEIERPCRKPVDIVPIDCVSLSQRIPIDSPCMETDRGGQSPTSGYARNFETLILRSNRSESAGLSSRQRHASYPLDHISCPDLSLTTEP